MKKQADINSQNLARLNRYCHRVCPASKPAAASPTPGSWHAVRHPSQRGSSPRRQQQQQQQQRPSLFGFEVPSGGGGGGGSSSSGKSFGGGGGVESYSKGGRAASPSPAPPLISRFLAKRPSIVGKDSNAIAVRGDDKIIDGSDNCDGNDGGGNDAVGGGGSVSSRIEQRQRGPEQQQRKQELLVAGDLVDLLSFDSNRGEASSAAVESAGPWGSGPGAAVGAAAEVGASGSHGSASMSGNFAAPVPSLEVNMSEAAGVRCAGEDGLATTAGYSASEKVMNDDGPRECLRRYPFLPPLSLPSLPSTLPRRF